MTFTPEQPEDNDWLDYDVVEPDLYWAKPLIDEALAEVERGETITLEEHRRRTRERLRALRRD